MTRLRNLFVLSYICCSLFLEGVSALLIDHLSGWRSSRIPVKTALNKENGDSDQDLTKNGSINENYARMVVIFGRPGAGKTTIANQAAEHLQNHSHLELDLDVCVPQWMRDNFGKGIYPTLQQRSTFAQEACIYVKNEVERKNKQDQSEDKLIVFVSFSFVNTDLREIFRKAFPDAHWALVDTTVAEADERIKQREGHFYTVAPAAAVNENEKRNDRENSEWEFAPVLFEHTILPGTDSVEENAKRVIRLVL